MIPAHSLGSIEKAVDETLGEFVTNVEVPTGDLGLVIPGAPQRTQSVTVESSQWSKLVGILFCLPSSKLGKDEIVPNLDYFHHRSGEFVDFFCPGYGAYWPPGDVGDEEPVATVGGVKWLFSAKLFNKNRSEVQLVSKWKFSGETDLLLLVARKRPQVTACLDFSSAISCNLEQMTKDQAVSSARSFFERIFEFGEKYDGEDPVWKLSDAMGITQGKSFLQEVILALFPESVRKLYKTSKHFVIQDISK